MLLTVKNGNGQDVTIIVQGQASPTDKSGVIEGASAQQVLDANGTRSGWFFQNLGTDAMFLNELGADATNGQGSIMVRPGECFPPCGYAVTTAPVSVLGTAGQGFTAREW